MVEKTITVANPTGIHARPAGLVVKFVQDYPGTVEIIKGEKTGNLKSILMVMSMGLKQGTQVTLRVSGEDEAAFVEKLAAFILSLED